MKKAQYVDIDTNNNKFYYKDKAMTILHRIDGPAIEYTDGYKQWCVNGKRHRLDGPAVEYVDGCKSWYVDGKLHRVDGPAVEYSGGSKAWYINGKLHRVDGPAIESFNGHKAWWIDGNPLSKTEFNLRTAKETVLTLEDIADKFGVDVKTLKITKEH